ncbi:citrate lyase subunit beta/citryl-CoA lyase [Sinobacterium caligoides]|uniref:Citrate lyase subunit beta/citryl-CoA lyase n=1 Tax=Sinobacterium caligoides TaxID=933926 RepID=A0A3N2E241_9GAMM|nr:CoA ester lyase [Sinobacterium caligoides]ROS05759.1 citrate lyase subunit beta/citryl-CoA lyase [Sinobacterium caligoides]
MHQLRPRRSVLYMPGSNSRALEKAKTLAVDCVVFDLEDACAPEVKASSRTAVIEAVAGGGYGRRELVIRINSFDSPWFSDDIEAVAQSQADAICLPKVESAQQIATTVELLERYGADETMTLWAMVETPLGVEHALQIASASPRLTVLMMGTSDLAKELRLRHTADRAGFHYALSRCVIAARLAGIDVIDGVHLDLDDEAGLVTVCEQGRDFGFDGKSLIHPRQIAAANDSFGFSAEAVDHARRLLAVWQQAASASKAVAVLDGKLIECLHVEEAKRVIAMAELIASAP